MVEWYWKNNYFFSLIAIEVCLCLPFLRRKNAAYKWTAITVLMFGLSSATMQNWTWIQNAIAASNIVGNLLWRYFLGFISAFQMLICYEITWGNALYLMAIAVICQHIQFNLYKIAESLLLGYVTSPDPGEPSLALCLIAVTIACCTVRIVFRQREKLYFKPLTDHTLTVLCALALMLSSDLFNAYLFINDPNCHIGYTMIVTRIYDSLFDSVTLYLLYNLTVRQTMKMEKLVTQAIARQHALQYESSRELMQLINIKSHDLKKQLRYLKKDSAGAEELVQELEETTRAFDSVISTENAALSTVLTERSAACAHEGIPLTIVCEDPHIDFVRELDIYTLFANLLDNAMEASRKIPPEQRSICVILKSTEGFLSIHQDNYFSGQLNRTGQQLLTTKSDSLYHGYGFQSMQQIVEHYGGSLSYHANDDVFSVNILIPFPETETVDV